MIVTGNGHSSLAEPDHHRMLSLRLPQLAQQGVADRTLARPVTESHCQCHSLRPPGPGQHGPSHGGTEPGCSTSTTVLVAPNPPLLLVTFRGSVITVGHAPCKTSESHWVGELPGGTALSLLLWTSALDELTT
eukprot:1394131-Rhodomonas_salina.2